MKFSIKSIFIKFCFIILIVLILSTFIYLFITKPDKSKISFQNFMTSYTSRNIEDSNDYLFNKSLPNLDNIFYINLKQVDNELQTQIIKEIENIIFSIDYEIISSKTFFKKSVLSVKFTYYDLAKHILNYFKTNNNLTQNTEENYLNFLNSLKSTKYKISTKFDISLTKNNGDWDIIVSDKLLNVLTAGIYKNFLT